NAVRVALLDDEIAALDPPELLESLSERIQGEGFGIGKQPADPGQAGLLPLDDERRGEATEREEHGENPRQAHQSLRPGGRVRDDWTLAPVPQADQGPGGARALDRGWPA